MGWNYAVPGAAWPGSILPGQVITAAAPPSGPPVIFTAVTARQLWTAVTARHLWTAGPARNNEGSGMILTQPAVSLQAVQVLVSALQNGTAYNPTSDPVAMAFVVNPAFGAAAAPAASSGTWNAATWETDTSSGLTQYWTSILVGPGAVTLTAGTSYTVFLKIVNASSGETPVLPACGLMIT